MHCPGGNTGSAHPTWIQEDRLEPCLHVQSTDLTKHLQISTQENIMSFAKLAAAAAVIVVALVAVTPSCVSIYKAATEVAAALNP